MKAEEAVALLIPVFWLVMLAAEAFGTGRSWPAVLPGVLPGVLIGFALLTLANALLHRAYHRFDLLWRWVHQLHHAPQRLDTPGAVLFPPQEVVLNVLVFQIVVVLVLGLNPLAAAIIGTLAVFYGLFNYADLPLWDLLWGTFRNPREFRGDVGFEAPLQVAPLLVGRDANAALYGPANRGRSETTGNPA